VRNAVARICIVGVALSLGLGGCSRSARTKDLVALDQALQSGALTQDEYRAKKAALESHAKALDALDKALAAGVFTEQEYAAKKAALLAASDARPDVAPPAPADIVPPTEASKREAVASLPSPAPIGHAPPASAVSTVPERVEPTAASAIARGLATHVLAAPAGLKSIDPPQGGKIVYGPVAGQTTEAGAMGAVLRSLHDQLGDRPQVGKLFQVRGTQSVAAFFSVTKRTSGNGQIAGLIIATKVTNERVEAALVTDDAARFPKTLSPMMKALVAVWHPLAGAPGVESATAAAAPAPLHQITIPDRSANVSLPDGWNIVPNRSGMGTIVALGPHGESAELGITFLASDTNNPNVQKTMQIVRNGGLRNTAYANGTYYPYGAELSKTYVDLIQDLRRRAGLTPMTYKFTSVERVPAPPQQNCIHLTGTSDPGDGKGAREFNGLYCTYPPSPRTGAWMSVAHMTSAPMSVAAAERPTLGAIMQSFSVNQAVVRAQASQIAAPAIDQIHAIGRAAAAQAAAAHERNDIHNSSVYQRWDNNDKRSQEFENYQLGYSVISDTQNTAHGTFWNEDAEALVKSNPDRFEYVSAPNYWKGIDY